MANEPRLSGPAGPALPVPAVMLERRLADGGALRVAVPSDTLVKLFAISAASCVVLALIKRATAPRRVRRRR